MKDFFKLPRNPKVDKEAWLRACLLKNESGLIRYVKSLIYNLPESELFLGGVLKRIEYNQDSAKPWVMRLIYEKGFVSVVKK